jgi:hypothetical protein
MPSTKPEISVAQLAERKKFFCKLAGSGWFIFDKIVAHRQQRGFGLTGILILGSGLNVSHDQLNESNCLRPAANLKTDPSDEEARRRVELGQRLGYPSLPRVIVPRFHLDRFGAVACRKSPPFEKPTPMDLHTAAASISRSL